MQDVQDASRFNKLDLGSAASLIDAPTFTNGDVVKHAMAIFYKRTDAGELVLNAKWTDFIPESREAAAIQFDHDCRFFLLLIHNRKIIGA